jgi:hypothetical protein
MAAGPHEDGELSLQVIGEAWSKTQQHWHDDLAGQFNRSHWTPLVSESQGYLRALAECLELLTAAERETDF